LLATTHIVHEEVEWEVISLVQRTEEDINFGIGVEKVVWE
jgi:hypothetical protein